MTGFLTSPRWDPERPALFDAATGTAWTHGAVRRAAAEMGAHLASVRRRLAFLLCRNSSATVISYLAAVEAGCAVVLLDGRANPEHTENLVELYRPDAILSEGDEPWGEAYRHVDAGQAHLWTRTDVLGEPVHPALSVLLSTSGTTGSPKLVRLARRNVEANASSIMRALGVGPDERAIASLPIHYSYGLSVLNSHLLANASIVLTDESVVASPFWELFREQACTSFAGVPYTYEILARIGFEKIAPRSLRTMTQAGGKLGNDLVRRFHDTMQTRGGRLFVMYGQTEATARMACLPPDRLPEKIGSGGVAIPDGQFLVESRGVLTTEPGITGEIVYRGPNVMLGYATSRADLADGDGLGGTLRTGDIGYLDAEGFVFITGRSKRIAKVFGLRINLDEIESRLRRHGPTAVTGGVDRIHVYCEYGEDRLFAELRRELAAELSLNHNAFTFHRVSALPLTGNGKLDYQALSAAV